MTVADAQYGYAQVEYLAINSGGAGLMNAFWPTGKDDALGSVAGCFGSGYVVRDDLREYVTFSDPAGDQAGVLGAEVDHQHPVEVICLLHSTRIAAPVRQDDPARRYCDQVESQDIERAIEAARRQVQSGKGLRGTGFWKAVAVVRADRTLAARWASEIGSIDRMAFENGVRLRVPAAVGTTVLSAGTGAAIVVLCLAERVGDQNLRTLLFFSAFGALLLTTHSLAHWLVGRIFGMRFTHYFLGGPNPPRPGAKVDYASYLRTSPRRRAVMHASGAVVTKILPFALIPVAARLELPGWSIALLALTGVVQIITDVLFSTKTSDWKKVKRELRAARRASEGGPPKP